MHWNSYQPNLWCQNCSLNLCTLNLLVFKSLLSFASFQAFFQKFFMHLLSHSQATCFPACPQVLARYVVRVWLPLGTFQIVVPHSLHMFWTLQRQAFGDTIGNCKAWIQLSGISLLLLDFKARFRHLVHILSRFGDIQKFSGRLQGQLD